MQQDHEKLSPLERRTLVFIAAAGLVLRVISYFRFRFDSDEPQHLHVAWGWTAGLLQYRDYFDNHAPLFHMATAPVLAMLGERPDILLYMRATMIPIWIVVLAATWMLARRFWSDATALAAVILLSIFPPFFLKSLEYRTDNAWSAACLAGLVVLAGGAKRLSSGEGDRVSLFRVFAGGLILGVALGVSMKTGLFLFSLAVAEIVMMFAFREIPRPRRIAAVLASFLVGFAIVPAAIAVYFAARGAWPNLVYCVVTFNELIAKTRTSPRISLLRLLYPVELFLLFRYARQNASAGIADGAERWRFRLALAVAVYMLTLISFWILISPRDALPMISVLAIFAVAWIRRRAGSDRQAAIAHAALAIVFFGFIVHYDAGFADAPAEHITMMNQVLKLSRPGEPLMDYKGETIYRQRPFYFIFETITREAMKKGLIADTVAAAVVKANCHVVQADGPFWPPESREFLSANFLDMGRLRASGQWLRPDGTFTIAIPGEYVVVNTHGEAKGTLDEAGYSGSRRLGAGPHRFDSSVSERLAVVWAPAIARGFSPFHLKDRDF